MTDPIADMLTRIRNAAAVRQSSVLVPHSRLKEQIAQVLVREGWLGAVRSVTVDHRPLLRVTLKYGPDGRSLFRTIRRVSTPGRRVYVSRGEIPVVLNNLGLAVLSTPKGILTNRDARQEKVGGEVLCEVF